jgi:hypothetical protein
MRTENLDRYQAMFELAGSQINAAVRWTRESVTGARCCASQCRNELASPCMSGKEHGEG